MLIETTLCLQLNSLVFFVNFKDFNSNVEFLRDTTFRESFTDFFKTFFKDVSREKTFEFVNFIEIRK